MQFPKSLSVLSLIKLSEFVRAHIYIYNVCTDLQVIISNLKSLLKKKKGLKSFNKKKKKKESDHGGYGTYPWRFSRNALCHHCGYWWSFFVVVFITQKMHLCKKKWILQTPSCPRYTCNSFAIILLKFFFLVVSQSRACGACNIRLCSFVKLLVLPKP